MNRSFIIKLILGLGLLVYLLTLIDFKEFFQVLSKGHLGYIGLSILIVLLDRGFMTLKWMILLRAQGIRTAFFECLRSYCVASFMGLVLPTSVGSDFVRLMSLSVNEGEREKVAASIIVEKVLSMVAMLILVCFCFFLLMRTHLFKGNIGWEFFDGSLVFLLIIAVIFVGSLYYLPGKKLQASGGRFLKIIARIVSAYQQFRNHQKAMLLFLMVSLVEQLVPFVFTITVARAFDLQGTAMSYFMVVPLIYFVARIPISVDAIGVLETLFVLLFPIVGLSKTNALLLALAGRVSTTLGHLIGGCLYFIRRKHEVVYSDTRLQ